MATVNHSAVDYIKGISKKSTEQEFSYHEVSELTVLPDSC